MYVNCSKPMTAVNRDLIVYFQRNAHGERNWESYFSRLRESWLGSRLSFTTTTVAALLNLTVGHQKSAFEFVLKPGRAEGTRRGIQTLLFSLAQRHEGLGLSVVPQPP